MSSSLCTLRIGVLGGGQLGRMLAEAAHRLGLSLSVLDPLGPQAPAGQVANESMAGSFMDADAVRSFANQCDILTVEIEHVDVETLAELEKRGDVIVRPSSACLGIIRDKLKQKIEFCTSDVPVIEFAECSSASALVEIAERRFGGFPVMLKARFSAYDGRGNVVVHSADDAAAAFQTLGAKNLYVERWAKFRCELAVMVARGVDGSVEAFPVVETRQKNSVCDAVFVPPTIGLSAAIEAEAQRVAVQAVEALRGIGVFGVELFLMDDDRVLLNEIAPRPHNSGHYSIEACETDQFEQHLRAITGLPLGSSALSVPAAAMLNLFGGEKLHERMQQALTVPGCRLHWYGKDGNRDGRKMAHLTLTASSRCELQERLQLLSYDMNGSSVDVGIIMGSDSDLPCMQAAADILREFGIAFELTVVSAHRTPDRMFSYARSARQRGLRVLIAGAGGAAHLPGMVAALTPLPVIGVPVKTSALGGQDSLLSIVQMPRGVPVATVAIGNAGNAALLAVRMLATCDSALLQRLEEFHTTMRSFVEGSAHRLEKLGDRQYLEEYNKYHSQ